MKTKEQMLQFISQQIKMLDLVPWDSEYKHGFVDGLEAVRVFIEGDTNA